MLIYLNSKMKKISVLINFYYNSERVYFIYMKKRETENRNKTLKESRDKNCIKIRIISLVVFDFFYSLLN